MVGAPSDRWGAFGLHAAQRSNRRSEGDRPAAQTTDVHSQSISRGRSEDVTATPLMFSEPDADL